MFKKAWNKIKEFFLDSEVIFMARLEAISGFMLMAIAGVNWAPLFTAAALPTFTWNQAMALGLLAVVHGIVMEWLRRRRDPTLTQPVAVVK